MWWTISNWPHWYLLGSVGTTVLSDGRLKVVCLLMYLPSFEHPGPLHLRVSDCERTVSRLPKPHMAKSLLFAHKVEWLRFRRFCMCLQKEANDSGGLSKEKTRWCYHPKVTFREGLPYASKKVQHTWLLFLGYKITGLPLGVIEIHP